LFHTTREQLKLHDRFAAAGISAVLGMGSAPGIPNIQARYAADRLDSIESIRIFDGIKPPESDQVLFTYAVPTIIDEMTMPPMVFRGGEFIERPPLSEMEPYWFASPIGSLDMHLSLHSEVATLPVSFAEKGVRECFFKINHWGMPLPVVEKVKVLAEFGFAEREPVAMNGSKVVPRDLLIAMMGRYVPPVTTFLDPPGKQPPDWVKELVTEVKGTKDGSPVVYRIGTLTSKSPLPTGVAPARGAVWQAAGRVPAGVHPPELAFEPAEFLKELEEREIFTQVTTVHAL
jgi:saccharopine dehydrogenase-like NADP-dependent oxidoreductase